MDFPTSRRYVETLLRVEDRIVDGQFVRAHWVLGSGYLIGGPWVLTCSHNIMEPGEITVRGFGPAHEARQLVNGERPKHKWRATRELWCDPKVIDLALLKLEDGPSDIPPAVFGQVASDDQMQQVIRGVTSVGFPAYKVRPDVRDVEIRESAHLYGKIPVDDSWSSGLLTFNIEDSPLRDRTRIGENDSQFGGMSGAAVMIGGQVIGVIREDPRRGPLSLSITPLTRLAELDRKTLKLWRDILKQDPGSLAVAKPSPADQPLVGPLFPPDGPSPVPPNASVNVLVVPNFAALVRPAASDVLEGMLCDLAKLRDSYGYLTPGVVMVPGGLVSRCSAEEYGAARAALERLLSALGLTAARLVVAPGASDLGPERSGESRWSGLIGMLDELHLEPEPGRLTEKRPWAWREFAAERLAIAVLNSAMYKPGDPQARLGLAQLDYLAALARSRRAEGWLCVGLVYDSPALYENERIHDADFFQERVGPCLHLVVHGRPRPYPHRFDRLGSLPVIGASGYSTGSYQILSFGPRPTLWARVYDPHRGIWTGDTDVGAEPRQWSRELA